MSEYDTESFEEDTPSPSPSCDESQTQPQHHSHVSTDSASASSSRQSFSDRASGPGGLAVPIPIPVSVPAPVPVATLPAVIPLPVPQPVATLPDSSSDTEDDDDDDEEDEGEENDAHSSGSGSSAGAATSAGEWRSRLDEASGRPYYYNSSTKETTWSRPAGARSASGSVSEGEVSRPFADSDGSFSRPFADSDGEASHALADSDGVRSRTSAATSAASTRHASESNHAATTANGASGSISVLPGPAGDRQRTAMHAEDTSEFQLLSDYVAFKSSGSPSMVRSSTLTASGYQRASSAAAPVTLEELLTPLAPASGATAAPAAAAAAGRSDGSDPHDSEAGKDAPTEEEPSSVFSTVSQHLKPLTATTAATAANSPPPTLAMTPAALQTSAPAPSPAPALELAPQVRFMMPALPPSTFSTVPSAAATLAASSLPWESPSPTGLVPPPLPSAARLFSGPPPAAAAAPVLDPKLAELRETSEAVERLVRAFATLRGHSGSNEPRKTASRFTGDSAAALTLNATTMHKVGALSTVRPLRESRGTAAAAVAPAATSAAENAALTANEGLVEEVLMTCVLDMLERDVGRAQRTRRIVDRVKAQPQHVLVSAANFRNGSSSKGGGAAPHSSASASTSPSPAHRAARVTGGASVFDSELRAFDVDGGDGADSAEALFHSVQSNLQRYVLSHVVDPTKPQARRSPDPSPGGGALPTPVTPHFAWILLMDLLAVCTEAVERCFAPAASDGPASIPAVPVIVRYDGERHCELLARNAIHCLPFEVVDTAPPPEDGSVDSYHQQQQQPRRRPLFRMEFWVTRACMFTVIEALTATVRQHVAHTAATAPYAIFATDINPYVNARVLAPSAVPMFSVVLDRNNARQRLADDGGAILDGQHSAKPRSRAAARAGADDNDDEEFFGIGRPNLQSIAFSISSIATGLLEKTRDQQAKSHARPRAGGASAAVMPAGESYDELAKAVTEAVGELLGDAGIRAAVERRSLEKFEAARKAAREYPTKDRLERERVVIARAEREAEDLVRKITQEMLVREVGV